MPRGRRRTGVVSGPGGFEAGYPLLWGAFRNHPPGARLSPLPVFTPFGLFGEGTAAPRMVWPKSVTVTVGTWIRLIAATMVFLAATGYLGLLLIQRGQLPPMVAYMTSIVGGGIWALHGA